MNARISLFAFLCFPFAASCFQKGPGPEGLKPPPVDAGNINVQCVNGSAACFTLCGSPECALPDASIPPVLDEPAIWYQPGGSVNSVGGSTPGKSTKDPCEAINDAALTIRKRSCAPCHSTGTAAAAVSHFDYVLDDMKLATSENNAQTTPMITPGHPDTASSYVFKRIMDGLTPGGVGMPPADLSILGDPAAQATVVYPTAADVSVIYAWILNCIPGANPNAYQTSYGSGLYGPAAGSTADGGVTGRD
jgi:hypothetical protein